MGSWQQEGSASALFGAEGDLLRPVFSDDAWEVLQACVAWLRSLGRGRLLPVDLILVLARRNHPGLMDALRSAQGSGDEGSDLLSALEALSRRIPAHGPDTRAGLHLDGLSLGLIGILEDALSWVRESGRSIISEADLVRMVRWRLELQDSNSIRWAVRKLASHGVDHFFDSDGKLRSDAFTPEVWYAFKHAMRLSARGGLPFVGTPHAVAALCQLPTGHLREATSASGVHPERLQEELLRLVGSRSPAQPEFPLTRRTLTPRLLRMIGRASQRAGREGRRIQEVDILDAFLVDGGSSMDLAKAMGIEHALRQRLSTSPSVEFEVISPTRAPAGVSLPEGRINERPQQALEQVGRDLSAEAEAGLLPDVHGREQELRRIINVLLRSEQRNPLLTGEAGVGKTALAMALAKRIHEGRVPKALEHVRVIEIHGASLVGGTSYRGELEARIKQVLEEAADNVVLFIDEAHAVFAPRSSAGQPAEIPNHFKAALASGKIAVIAATTEAEYQRWIEKDPALKRRFERIVIPELSPDATKEILRKLAPDYERRYEVSIHPDAIDAAIDLSMRFMPEQALPDKAKKVLMDAAIALSTELASQAQGRKAAAESGTPSKRVVGRYDVAQQISLKTQIPLDRIEKKSSLGWWAALQERLDTYVVGQSEAARALASGFLTSRVQQPSDNAPLGVFVFVGPPGVGQVELARGLAIEVFGSDKALLRVDLSDYQESHSMSRLIGAAPGYVGYQDEDALVTPLRRRPGQVVLLQGFDLAHPRIQERLVRVFHEGEIADTQGLRADTRHAIFVLTIERKLQAKGAIGFGADGKTAPSLADVAPTTADCLRSFPYHLVPFHGLGDQGSRFGETYVMERLARFQRMLAEEFGREFTLDDALRRDLLERASALKDVRDIEPLLQELVIQPTLAQILQEGEVPATSTNPTSRRHPSFA